MSKYDKELDTRTEEYEEAIEPLERETKRKDEEEEKPKEKAGERWRPAG